MIPGPFNYLAPNSLDEAVALLAEHGEDAKILASGHSLIPAMRFRLASPDPFDLSGFDSEPSTANLPLNRRIRFPDRKHARIR